MKTLHLYLTRQVLAALVMTVIVFTFVLLLANVLREIAALLINQQATLWTIVQAIGLLIPFVMVFALPMGFLTATLLIFGRLSADQELTAMRGNGISLLALITPVLWLSLAMSGLCAWINMQVAPQCRVAYKELLHRVGTEQVLGVLPAGRFISDFPGYIIFVGRSEGDQLGNVILKQMEDNVSVLHVRAAGGRVRVDRAKQQMILQLTNAHVFERYETEWRPVFARELIREINLQPITKKIREPRLTDLTLGQLLSKQRELQQLERNSFSVRDVNSEPLASDPDTLERMNSDLLMPIRLQIHRQIAFSFACISFTLVGIPLGLRTHRRETSVGVALAVVLVLAYYSFIILGESLETRAEFFPHLIVWFPNFLFQTIGIILLWRANRGVG